MGANAAYSSQRFECIEAVDGDDAVDRTKARHPDLIVLDIEVGGPALDGLDTWEQIRSLGLARLAIFLTGWAAVEHLESRLGGDPATMVPALRRF